jgi:RNA polymerase sigma-70 factor (ECF subfamily)
VGRPSPANHPDDAGVWLKVNGKGHRASNEKDGRSAAVDEDRALLVAAQAGDMAAFRTLVERYQRRAFNVAFALVRDEQDAREIVQESFLRAYRNLSKFKGDSAFFTWLYRIVTNLSIDLVRRPGRRAIELDSDRINEAEDVEVPLTGTVKDSDPAEVLRRGEMATRLQAAFDALPGYHRAVIVLRELEGLSYEEMAQALGVSKGTIMSRLFHARLKLQKALADLYEEQFGEAPAGTRAPSDLGGDE